MEVFNAQRPTPLDSDGHVQEWGVTLPSFGNKTLDVLPIASYFDTRLLYQYRLDIQASIKEGESL